MTSSTAGNPSPAAPRWSGLNGAEVVHAFSSGFGRILGDFALILLPPFVLAACMSRQQLNGADRIAATSSPSRSGQ
jgi:GntP family gluconate:H+ symporter